MIEIGGGGVQEGFQDQSPGIPPTPFETFSSSPLPSPLPILSPLGAEVTPHVVKGLAGIVDPLDNRWKCRAVKDGAERTHRFP